MGGGADLPGIYSILVDPRDLRRVSIGVSIGGIWSTDDGGAHWKQRGHGMRADHVPPELTHDPIAQDVHCLAQCPAAPERMWVQHHNGIFVSSDEGQNFTEITGVEPSTFGFPVVVHPGDPDTAWFVPEIKDEKRIPRDGRLVVTRTRDGGKSFETLTNGLPQSHAYDVVYRHALTIDGSGELLAFGSTTGGLWVSENAGDSWSEVTHTLPPIYAVRLAWMHAGMTGRGQDTVARFAEAAGRGTLPNSTARFDWRRWRNRAITLPYAPDAPRSRPAESRRTRCPCAYPTR